MAQAGNRAGKTQPCKQMGENELEWMSVTSGSMNVCNSTFFNSHLKVEALILHSLAVRSVTKRNSSHFGLELVVSLSKPFKATCLHQLRAADLFIISYWRGSCVKVLTA